MTKPAHKARSRSNKLRLEKCCAGVAVTLVSVLYFRLADWPLYLVYVGLSSALVLPSVEVLPGVLLLVPELATTLGFLFHGMTVLGYAFWGVIGCSCWAF